MRTSHKTAVLCLLLFACKKSDNASLPAPEIYAISPTEGQYMTRDTINGTGFDTTMVYHNSVYFNGKGAQIISFNSTRLVVYVPQLAGTGPVTITVDGRKTTGPVFTFDTTGVATVYAGNGQAGGAAVGLASYIAFREPFGLAVDTSENVYVADSGNLVVREVLAKSDSVITLAGNGVYPGLLSPQGAPAVFGFITQMAIDDTGNLYVLDPSFYSIQKISPDGVVTTVYSGFQNQTYIPGNVSGIAVDGSGDIYYSDDVHDQIVRVNSGGVATIVAGSGTAGFKDATGTAASFNMPCGLALGSSGNLYVADAGNNAIRVVTPGGAVTTLAGGNGAGLQNGTAGSAQFSGPNMVVVDKQGRVYVNDYQNKVIRKIGTSGMVSTYCTGGAGTGENGPFGFIGSMAIDGQGAIYVTNLTYNTIQKITLQ